MLVFHVNRMTDLTRRVWISSTDAVSVVEKGFRIVQVPSDYFYLVRLLSALCYLV